MIRRQARERREYIYRKAQETQERQTYERKQKLKDALASGKSLPTELRKDAGELGKTMTMDESQAEPSTHIDDEYARAGTTDPNIVITTSRDPSSKLLQFAKEMRLVFPNSHRINRGNYVVRELADACRANDVTDLVVLHEHRGVPDALIVSHFPHGPTVYFSLHNVGLRHDIATYSESTVSEQYPHLLFEGFSSQLGRRVMDVLRYLFPVPKPDATRVMTFANENDFISFRHHVFARTSHKDVQLAEVGPRFEMKRECAGVNKTKTDSPSVRDPAGDDRADDGGQGVGAVAVYADGEEAPPAVVTWMQCYRGSCRDGHVKGFWGAPNEASVCTSSVPLSARGSGFIGRMGALPFPPSIATPFCLHQAISISFPPPPPFSSSHLTRFDHLYIRPAHMSAPATYPPAPVSAGPPSIVTSPRSKRPRPPDLHTGPPSGLPAAPVSSGPASAGFTPASATGGDDVFHQEDGEDAEDDDDDDEGRGRKGTEKKAGRRKIKIEFIQDKSRRHITFSKRKAGIMKKAYELSTLTGTQVLLLVVSETGLVYTFTTAKLQPLVTQPEGKNLIQACLNAPNGSLPGGGPSGPGMPPPPPASRGRNLNLGVPGGTSPSHDAEGEDDGEGSADSPSMGSAKGRRRRRTNSSSGAVPGGNMTRPIGSPSESMPSTSPTLSMQQAHGVSGGAAPYNAHPATHSPTLPPQHHHQHHPMGEPGMYAGYRGEGGASNPGMMPNHHYSQYSAMNAGGMPSGLNTGSVPAGSIGQSPGQPQSQMWMQQGNMQRR